MRLQCFFISVTIALITANAEAQNDSARNHLMIVPHYFAFNGIRIDYERHIKKNHWIQLSPQYYFGNVEQLVSYNSDYEFRNISGVGLDLYHKIYIAPEKYHRLSTYISYGVVVNYLTLKFINSGDSLKQTLSKSFPKVGGDLIIGFDVSIPHVPIIFGSYAGIGFRYSFTDNADVKGHFTKNYYDFAYSGNLFVFGFKLGVRF
jgi:hypothetical protein